MAGRSSPTSTSPYRVFQRLEFKRHGVPDNGLFRLVDSNGAIFYETEGRGLLLTIIEQNDAATLSQYLTQNPWAIHPGDTYRQDPFWFAARHGSSDALRVLLEHYNADPTVTEVPLETRGFLLLTVACQFAQLNTVRFLLDSKPALGKIEARDDEECTALLGAASSLANARDVTDDFTKDSIHDYLDRAEELINLLLDRGASARDVIPGANGQPYATVLGRAISRASPELLKRLIDEGADVHAKQRYYILHSPVGQGDYVWDVTPLHVGSFYSNFDGIQVLFDRRNSGIDIVDMASCCDSLGRLPLHFAAGGSYTFEPDYMFPEDDYESRVVSTIKLLLTSNPNTINTPDKQGKTPLHYAVSGYRPYSSLHFNIIKILCENGANASLRDKKEQTPLHCLALHVISSRFLDTDLIDLLLAYGANVSDADTDGNTLLHLVARHLRNIEAARLLLSKGADVDAKNSKENTPLHEAAGENTRFENMGLVVEHQLEVQDIMVNVLLEAGRNDNLMDQRNAAGKTPRQIREEKRNKLLQNEELAKQRLAGTGRGRARERLQQSTFQRYMTEKNLQKG